MSRPLKIPRDQALQAAMVVFWSKGYNATSVDDLQAAMGIQRGSFYFHFQDKRTLFIEVLDYYKKTVVEKRRELVRKSRSPKKGIQLYFKLLLAHLLESQVNSGCLNTNSSTELGLNDQQVSEKLGLGMKDWQNFWVEILRNAKLKNEVPASLDTVSVAGFLVALTQGLNVIARVNPDHKFLKGVVKSGLSILDNP